MSPLEPTLLDRESVCEEEKLGESALDLAHLTTATLRPSQVCLRVKRRETEMPGSEPRYTRTRTHAHTHTRTHAHTHTRTHAHTHTRTRTRTP